MKCGRRDSVPIGRASPSHEADSASCGLDFETMRFGRRRMLSWKAHKHFSKIAKKYRNIRTTDLEPITFIVRRLRGMSHIIAADVGCGAGRYDMKLFRHLGNKIERLYCLDVTLEMLNELSEYLSRSRIRNFEPVRSAARNIPFASERMNCIFNFNAVHHFRIMDFLNEASRVLRPRGFIFVYTRFRSQNRRNIWGTHFPHFGEKETRLYEFGELEQMLDAIPTLEIEHIRFFEYRRVSTLKRLLEVAQHRHYSTFSLYPESEFQACLAEFEKNIRKNFLDIDNVRWTDENVMLILRKE